MNCLKVISVCFLFCSINLQAASFEEAFSQLELENPELLVHVNVENDFNMLGEVLTEVYLEYLKTSPSVPPVPVSCEKLFERLGLTNLRTLTMASEKAESGYLNQSLTSFSGEPQGLFRVIGTENLPLQSLVSSPADADIIGEFSLNTPVLLEIIQSIMVDLMGPLGQGMLDAQLTRPLTEDGLTARDIINQMNTRVQFAMKLPAEVPRQQQLAFAMLSGKSAIKFNGMGNILGSLAPVLANAGFQSSDGKSWQISIPLPDQALLVKLDSIHDAQDLLVSFSEDSSVWFLSGDSKPVSLIQWEESIADYPEEGLAFFYDSGKFSELQVKSMWAGMEMDEKFHPLMQVVENFLMRFTGPQLSVSFMESDNQRTMAWQPLSTKASIGMIMVALPAAMAIGYGQAMEEAKKQAGTEQVPGAGLSPQ